jgi:membrane-bound serine protease (ClpP class)
MPLRTLRIALALGLIATGAWALVGNAGAQSAGTAQTSGTAYSIELNATINPATAKWISSALDDAADQDASLAIIRLDTPGGLSDSMRDIIKDMAAAPIPVAVYVSPDGARAGSAGAYITEAADVAAMAPETNIGSATPIAIGPGGGSSDLDRKIKNDAAASMRALAANHGRNAHLAGLLVTQAKNLTAEEAKRDGLIDVIATDQEDLLKKLDGFQVKGTKAQTLHTAGLEIDDHDMPLQYELLSILVDPTVSYLLILLGLVGLGIELFSPGLIFPGAVGVVSFVLGLYGSAQLPVTVAGVLLLVFGVAMIVAEAHLGTHGILGVVGVGSLIASGLLLYDTKSDAFETSAPVVVFIGLTLGGLLAFAVQRAVAARRRPVITGWEEMVGAVGEVRQALDPVGQIFVNGALWRARLADSEASAPPVPPGVRVRVESVDGLTLKVRPLEREAAAGRTELQTQGVS